MAIDERMTRTGRAGEVTRRRTWVGRVIDAPVVSAAIGVAILLIVWQGTVVINQLPSVVMPTPVDVVLSLGGFAVDPAFWNDVAVSALEFVIGFGIGVGGGVLTGVVLAALRPLRLAVAPLIETFRFIVPFAWIPLTVLWFGVSMWGKVWLVSYAVYFVMVISTSDSLARVDPTLLRVGTMLGMSRRQRLLRITLRAAAPSIANAARAAAALGWIAVVAAEYVGSSAGLGYLIINASSSLDTAVVIASMVVIGVIGAAISWIITVIIRKTLSYQ